MPLDTLESGVPDLFLENLYAGGSGVVGMVGETSDRAAERSLDTIGEVRIATIEHLGDQLGERRMSGPNSTIGPRPASIQGK